MFVHYVFVRQPQIFRTEKKCLISAHPWLLACTLTLIIKIYFNKIIVTIFFLPWEAFSFHFILWFSPLFRQYAQGIRSNKKFYKIITGFFCRNYDLQKLQYSLNYICTFYKIVIEKHFMLSSLDIYNINNYTVATQEVAIMHFLSVINELMPLNLAVLRNMNLMKRIFFC